MCQLTLRLARAAGGQCVLEGGDDSKKEQL